MDTIFISGWLPVPSLSGYVGKEEENLAGKSPCTALLGELCFFSFSDWSLATPKWDAGKNKEWKLGNDLEANLMEVLRQTFPLLRETSDFPKSSLQNADPAIKETGLT